jgi:hypothetical protein
MRSETMLMRFASIISVVSSVACVSPVQQAKQQPTVVAMHAGQPIAGNPQALAAWWPIQFADQNKCAIQRFQPGTDAFAHCVRMTMNRQSTPHRCTCCRSLD